MKTKHTQHVANHLPSGSINESPLDSLLVRASETQQASSLTGDTVNGLLLGSIHSFTPDGVPLVHINQLGTAPVAAYCITPLSPQDVGRQVALGFENGLLQKPIILGLMHHLAAIPQIKSAQPLHIEQDGQRTVIEAAQELELRCGDAVIVLQADGRIQLRGEYITSHASAGQRIRGGSVQIN